jgi:cellulose synthase (UDP-forming)
MRFYRPAVRAILVAAPMLALVWRLPMVHTSPAALAAYALPHWILSVFVGAAQEAKGRLPLITLLREYLVAISVLRRTLLSYVRTELRYGLTRTRASKPVGATRFSLAEQLVYGVSLAIYFFVVLGVCVREGSNLWRPENGMYVLYLIWAIYNASLVIADMAASKESGMVRKVLQEQSRLSAMVRLPTGHLLACRTENFPSIELALQFPTETTIPTGILHVSIFKGHREYTFAADLRRKQGRQAWLVIEGTCVDEYEALGRAVFSRNSAWPEWLPGRHADRVLPLWTHRFIEVLEGAFYNQIMRFSKHSLWQLCVGWFKRGK